jgi:hypothetical protein
MINNWPPPEGGSSTPPNWGPPQGQPGPNWQQQPPAYGWPPQNGYGMPHKTVDDKLLEWTVPINRSGLAVGAGYAALLSFPILIAAPIGVLLGTLALRDLAHNPHKLGKGRAWFAIIYGGLGTVVLLCVLLGYAASLAAR